MPRYSRHQHSSNTNELETPQAPWVKAILDFAHRHPLITVTVAAMLSFAPTVNAQQRRHIVIGSNGEVTPSTLGNTAVSNALVPINVIATTSTHAQAYLAHLGLPLDTTHIEVNVPQNTWDQWKDIVSKKIRFNEPDNQTRMPKNERRALRDKLATRIAFLMAQEDETFRSTMLDALAGIQLDSSFQGNQIKYTPGSKPTIKFNPALVDSSIFNQLFRNTVHHHEGIALRCPTEILESEEADLACRFSNAVQYPLDCEQWQAVRNALSADFAELAKINSLRLPKDPKHTELSNTIRQAVMPENTGFQMFRLHTDLNGEKVTSAGADPVTNYFNTITAIPSQFPTWKTDDAQLANLISALRSSTNSEVFAKTCPRTAKYLQGVETTLHNKPPQTAPVEPVVLASQTVGSSGPYFGVWQKTYNTVAQMCQSVWGNKRQTQSQS